MASNWEVARFAGPRLPFEYYRAPQSLTIVTGDVLVLTTAAAYATATEPVLRYVLADDDDSSRAWTVTTAAGIVGIADYGAVTNSSGVASSQQNFSGKAAASEPIFSAPSQGLTLPVDATTSQTLIRVILACDEVEFYAPRLASEGAGTTALIGTLAGIDVATTTNVATISTAASTKPVLITGLDPNDSSRLMVRVLRSYQQAYNHNYYTAA